MLLRALLTAWLCLSAAVAQSGEAYDRMSPRDPDTQDEILGIEIRSSGNRCNKVLWSMYLGEYRTRDIYSAQCNDGFDYLVAMQYRGTLIGGVRVCRTVGYELGITCWRRIQLPRN